MLFLSLCIASCAHTPDIQGLEASIIAVKGRTAPIYAKTKFGNEIERAVNSNPTVGKSNANLKEKEASIIATSGAFLPEVSVGAKPSSSKIGASAYLSVSTLLYDGGASRAQQTAARARYLNGLAGLHEARSQAALLAVEAWIKVLEARALLDASKSTFLALQKTFDKIKERTVAGVGTSGELLVAGSRLANDQANIAIAQYEVDRAEAVFRERFGYTPSKKMSTLPLAPSIPLDDLSGSPILKQLEASLFAAKAEHATAIARSYPSLSLAISAITPSTLTIGPISEQAISPARDIESQIAAAEARIEARQMEIISTTQELETKISSINAEIQSIRRRVEFTLKALEANKLNLSTSREQFEAGRVSLLSLLETEREALSAEKQHIQAKHDEIILGYAALAATGDILDLFGIERTQTNADK